MVSPKRKEELIDKYRYDLVEYDGWLYNLRDEFNDFLWQRCSIRAYDITYCFGSNTASFSFGCAELALFLKTISLDEKYPEWVMRSGTLEASNGRRYTGYGNVSIIPDDDVIIYKHQEGDAFKEAVARQVYDKTEETCDAMTNDVNKFITEMNIELFGRIKDEYEYLTSDEIVWDNIINNEWHLEYEDEQENENAND